MERVKQLFAGMRARDVAFMGGYALYLAFGYMSFESPTVLTSLGEAGHLVQSVFLIAVIVARFAVYAHHGRAGTSHGEIGVDGGLRGHGRHGGRWVRGDAHGLPVRRVRSSGQFGAVPGVRRRVLRGGRCVDQPLCGHAFPAPSACARCTCSFSMSNMLSLVVYFLVTPCSTPFMLPLGAALFFVSVVCAKRSLDLRAPISEEYLRAGVQRHAG